MSESVWPRIGDYVLVPEPGEPGYEEPVATPAEEAREALHDTVDALDDDQVEAWLAAQEPTDGPTDELMEGQVGGDPPEGYFDDPDYPDGDTSDIDEETGTTDESHE